MRYDDGRLDKCQLVRRLRMFRTEQHLERKALAEQTGRNVRRDDASRDICIFACVVETGECDGMWYALRIAVNIRLYKVCHKITGADKSSRPALELI